MRLAVTRSEATKLFTSRSTWTLTLVAVLGTWPMAWTNAAPSTDAPLDDPRLFSAQAIPVEYQGFEMSGFGYVLVVAVAAIWAGSEYGSGQQIRTTFLATPNRLRVFIIKALLLAVTTAGVGLLAMGGTIVITHAAGSTGVDPWTLTPSIWAHIGGVTVAWTLTALIAFAVGTLSRTAILPLVLVMPLVIGVGDFLAGFWDGAKYLPVAAGAALYSDPAAGGHLDPASGAFVQTAWALILLTIAGVAFTRRDL